MEIRLRPPTDVAGIRIGSTRAEAQDACSRLGSPEDFRRGGEGPASLVVRRPSGLAVFVNLDTDDKVEAIEVARPDTDDDVVLHAGVDVFATPADDLVERLGADGVVEIEEEGRSATAVDLLLALWRPVLPEGQDGPDGRFFESVLVAAPGYYD